MVSSQYRSQHRNRETAKARLEQLVASAIVPPKKRRTTRPTRGSVERRLDAKKKRSQTKQGRRARLGLIDRRTGTQGTTPKRGAVMTIAPPEPDEVGPDEVGPAEGPDIPDLPDPAFPEVLPGSDEPGPSEIPDDPETAPEPDGP